MTPDSPRAHPPETRVHRTFLRDVLDGLGATPKTLPSKYFYDQRGLDLFNAIRETPEYYLTRAELGIMRSSADEIAALLGPGCLLIEYGSGAADKACLLLDRMIDPVGCVMIDISAEHLAAGVDELRETYPDLFVEGVVADFTKPFNLPEIPASVRRQILYFAGSTLGNFDRHDADDLLTTMRSGLRAGDGLLLGVDLVKDVDTLLRAYDDEAGITADFNRNLLAHINRELGADFRPGNFAHRASWNAELQRIEMHLISRGEHTVSVGGRSFDFLPGEGIHTESSHKYRIPSLAHRAAAVGFELEESWTDRDEAFAVLLFRAAGP